MNLSDFIRNLSRRTKELSPEIVKFRQYLVENKYSVADTLYMMIEICVQDEVPFKIMPNYFDCGEGLDGREDLITILLEDFLHNYRLSINNGRKVLDSLSANRDDEPL